MAIAAFPYTSFTGTILSSQVMADFNHLRDHYNSNAVELSGNQTVAGVKTFSDIPVFSLGATITAGGVTVTAGNVALTAGNLTFGAASARIIPGATSLLFRDTANANTNVTITDAGAVTIRNGLTVSAGTTAVAALTATTINGTVLTASTNLTASKIVMNSTLVLRDSTDTTTAFTFAAGSLTLGASVSYSQPGGASVSAVSFGQSISMAAATSGNIEIGAALATNATSGYLAIGSCAGTPTGAPTFAGSNMVAMQYDRTNNRIYFLNGGTWRSVAVS